MLSEKRQDSFPQFDINLNILNNNEEINIKNKKNITSYLLNDIKTDLYYVRENKIHNNTYLPYQYTNHIEFIFNFSILNCLYLLKTDNERDIIKKIVGRELYQNETLTPDEIINAFSGASKMLNEHKKNSYCLLGSIPTDTNLHPLHFMNEMIIKAPHVTSGPPHFPYTYQITFFEHLFHNFFFARDGIFQFAITSILVDEIRNTIKKMSLPEENGHILKSDRNSFLDLVQEIGYLGFHPDALLANVYEICFNSTSNNNITENYDYKKCLDKIKLITYVDEKDKEFIFYAL